jgi:hypothetical protein
MRTATCRGDDALGEAGSCGRLARDPMTTKRTTAGAKDGTALSAKPEDSFVGRAATPSGRGPVTAEAAPEVSQGLWRERVFTPRGTMTREEIVQALEASLRNAVGRASSPLAAFEMVRQAWLPTLRQALEQAGGDGIDAWLLALLKPPGRAAADPLFRALVELMVGVRASTTLADLDAAGRQVIELVRGALSVDRPRRLSFKQMERELEGKLEVHELLLVRLCSPEELEHRLRELGNTMDQLRDQLKLRPGQQPDGMFANFVRLKAERRVLEAERAQRLAGARPP